MAKKKRRRLKKSVRRGCALVLAVPLLVCLYFLVKGLCDWGHAATEEPQPVAMASAADSARVEEMRTRLARLFDSPQRLDTATISIEVYDLTTQSVVYGRHADRLVPPASCMKVLTAVAAMQLLGIGHEYVSRVLVCGEQQGQTLQGDLVFRLDDDPLLESLEPLVEAVSRRGIRRVEGGVVLELVRDDTLRAHPTASVWDIPYNRLPILLKGRARVESELRRLLQSKGIVCPRSPFLHERGAASEPETEIGRHATALADVLAPMLIHSSNIKADALFTHVARGANRWPLVRLTPSEWLRTMAAAVDGYDARFVINDGSGLSPDNRLTAHFLVRLLRYAWDRDDMRHLLLDEALATPGHPTRHGSLLGRMSEPLYRNRIFVKTGTLTTRALSSLAGYAQGADGHWYVFAIVNEDSPVAESRLLQDRLCQTLLR